MSHTREEIIERGLLAALELAATRSWDSLTLSDIAAAAGLELNDFHGVASKTSLGEAVEPWFDKAMSGEGIDTTDSPRERLFDVIMLRFEAMEPHRQGLLTLMDWRERNPVQLAKLLAARKASADWALVSAGLDGGEQMIPGDVRAVAVAYVMGKVERAWRKETDPGFARTMSALDKELRDLESRTKMVSRFTGFRGRKSRGDNPAGDAPDAPSEEAGDGPEGRPGETSPA